MKLYHLTGAENLPSIRRRGLLPFDCGVYPGVGKCVWFTKRGRQPGEVFATILTVELDRNDPRWVYVKWDDWPPPFSPGGWWAYRGTIPPNKIDFTQATIPARMVKAWRRDHPTRRWSGHNPKSLPDTKQAYFWRWLDAYRFSQA